ncbi:hypothetical protein [Burkholderia anthina]|uniref:hypothetical protein n=1 Tax=Burkholderia anthina TaxID=179879 RepID=UPI00158D2A53|nr:hypothetical protein [Burkholderia anthina]
MPAGNDTPRVTRHAVQRWAERFPGEDMTLAFAQARRVGKKVRAKIKAECPAHAPKMRRDAPVYYVMTRDRIVFVVAMPETIVTVFRLPMPGNT